MKIFTFYRQKQFIRRVVGCFLVLVPFLSFAQAPVANFSVDKVEGCGITVVTFTDLSTNNPDSLIWDFGGGKISTPTISADRKYSNVYSTPGVYEVRLRAFNDFGNDVEIKSALITIHPNPTVNFSNSPGTACVGSSVQFTDLTVSDVPITNWQWNFGNGNFSTLQNPTHTYVNSNTYNITLSVTNQNGCQSFLTKPSSLVVNPSAVANFSAPVTEGCTAPFTANFSSAASTGPITSYSWDFGDGTSSTDPNPSHQYNVSGDYTVALTVSTANGCSNTMSRSNYIHVNTFTAGISSVDNSVCLSQTLNFIDGSSAGATSWLWDFGDGFTSTLKNPAHAYAVSAGDYTVTLTATNSAGCSKTVSITDYAIVYPLPVVTFSVDDNSSCITPFTTQFTNTNTANSWLWAFGDGTTSNLQNPTHTYNAIGNYMVMLQVTDANSCVNSLIEPNYIQIQVPEAGFTSNITDGCGPLTINFSDNSVIVNPITDWSWDFGNGDVSTAQNPNYTYPADTGRFDVTLTILDNAGCTSTITMAEYIGVGMKPIGEFEVDDSSICYKTTVIFNDLSSSYANSWDWDFGDGGSSLLEDPSYTYATDTAEIDFYDVELIVGHYECYDTVTKPDFVQVLLPIARYVPTPGVLCNIPDTVEFTNMAVGAETYLWTFGDGETLFVEGDTLTWGSGLIDTIPGFLNPRYGYNTTGLFNTRLTVTNSNGCRDSLEIPLSVSMVTASFNQDTVETCQLTGISFNSSLSTTQDASTSITNWMWDFGDGTPVVTGVANPIHVYNTNGTYDIEFIAINNLGCSNTISLPSYITIYEIPNAQFTANVTSGCAPLYVEFNETSTVTAPENIMIWNWAFGDGNTLIVQNNLDGTYTWTYNGVEIVSDTTEVDPIHTYQTRGSYSVSLTITDSKNCTHTLNRANYIVPSMPYPSFTVAPITCHYNQVVFTNTSTGQTISEWDFGDSSPLDYTVSPSHKYSIVNDITINVILRVEDAIGCDSSLSIPIQVIRPNADFYALHPIIPCYRTEADTIVNTSSSLTGTITSYSWLFEDPLNPFNNTSIIEEPVYLYSGPGIYDIQLIIGDSYGCGDTLLRQDYIEVGGPAGTMVFTPTIACAPEDISFTATAINTTKYHWYFDNGNQLIDQSTNTITYTYEDGRVYTPAVVLEDDNGCLSDAITGPENLIIYQAIPDFTADIEFACQDTVVTFTDLTVASDVISSWEWSFGDTDSAFIQNPSHYYTQGEYDVSLTTTLGICEYSISKPLYIRVYEMPNASFTVSKNPAYMLETLQFTNTTDSLDSPITWLWSVEEGLEDTSRDVSHFYIDHGIYPVMLQASTNPLCIDTAIVNVEILDKVYIPNAFTPGNDNINDVYLGGMNLQLLIVNRWGETLYDGTDGWDGKHNGKDVSAGTYFYIIKLPNGDVFKGPVTLIR